ncbi:MAG: hypothetical protein MUD01_12210 [Chloroflexaceae bacterium]|jgi:DNA-3-methyladenine glycosylase II|nr:hypothetical protein [Chloroflexaceae bacterium]
MNTIALRPPYDFARSIRFWRRSTGELCEQWADGVYRRVIVFDAKPTVLALHNVGTLEAPAVTVELDERPATVDETARLAPLVRGLLADDSDVLGFYAAVADDPPMAALTERLRGLRPNRSPLWETLCWTICGQQISVAFAYMLKERLVRRYGAGVAVAGRTLYAFPAPAVLAAADPAELAAMQFSANKASFIIGLAQQLEARTLDLEGVASLPTNEAITYLTSFRGIGRWTAEFTLLRGLGRASALPANDAGVRQAITALYGQKLPEPELRVFAQRWDGWGGIVALYLLASLRKDE